MGKHSRAKKARKDLSKWVQEVLTRAHDGDRQATRELFEQSQSLESTVGAGMVAGDFYDMTRKALDEVFQPRLACKKGCAYCCHIPVAVSVPEAVNALKFAEATFSPERFARLLQRLAAADELVASLTPEQRAHRNLACPFLEQDQCSIYEARPVGCRAWHSLDVEPCKAGYKQPEAPPETPTVAPLLFAGDAVREGLRVGLQDAYLDGSRIDLIRGAHWLATDPEAVERWLAGVSVPDEVRFRSPNSGSEPG